MVQRTSRWRSKQLVYFYVAAATSWQATLGAAALGFVTIALLNTLIRTTRRAGAKQTSLLKDLLARLTDILYAVKPLKAMARESFVGPLLEKKTQRLNRALQREVLSKEALDALHEPLLVATVCAGLYVALSKWGLPIERVILLAILFGRLLGHLQRIQKNHQRMAACDSAFWSMRETIDEAAAARETTEGTETTSLARAIELRDVTLAYGSKVVLDHTSLVIPKGQVTVIVGPSGAGKTSIVDIVTGLVRPGAGEVFIDDLPLARADIKKWRGKIGYVPQETLLLHESVAVNVTLGDPNLRPLGRRVDAQRRQRLGVRVSAAGGHRYHRRRARHGNVGRPASAHRNRARPGASTGAVDSRRSDGVARPQDRRPRSVRRYGGCAAA